MDSTQSWKLPLPLLAFHLLPQAPQASSLFLLQVPSSKLSSFSSPSALTHATQPRYFLPESPSLPPTLSSSCKASLLVVYLQSPAVLLLFPLSDNYPSIQISCFCSSPSSLDYLHFEPSATWRHDVHSCLTDCHSGVDSTDDLTSSRNLLRYLGYVYHSSGLCIYPEHSAHSSLVALTTQQGQHGQIRRDHCHHRVRLCE